MAKSKANLEQVSNQQDNNEKLIEMLRAQPDFFVKNPAALELIQLKDDRGTSSLLEKQVEQLKLKIEQHKVQQQQLLEVVRDNEEIDTHLYQICNRLIGFNNLSEFATELPILLKKTFNIDEVSFKTLSAVEKRESELTAYQDTLARLKQKNAMCDNRWPKSILSLFFENEIQSAAVIPLLKDDSNSDESILGILALGAKDANRYTHDLGTSHLERLGLMAGICLARLQPNT